MKSKIVSVLLLLCLCLMLVLPSCSSFALYEKFYYDLFDTITVIRGYAKSSSDFEESCNTIYNELQTCHKLFDAYNEYEGINNIFSVNKNAGVSPLTVDGRIIELLEFSKQMYEKTDGALNVAMGAVLELWRDCREKNENKLPYEDELKEAAEHCDINGLVVDKESSSVYLEDRNMSLDMGAIAKGYACDRVTALLPSTKLTAALVNLGGNVMTYGEKPDESGWNIGVNSPLGEGNLFEVECSDLCVITSGDYQRYFVVDGKRYHHIIDPETLYPGSLFCQVTVICENGAMGDALSTALFLTELEKGMEIADLSGAAVVWVATDGTVYKNQRAEELIFAGDEI